MLLPASMDQMGGLPAVCPRCGRVVPVQGGTPHITSSSIELWHDTCWDVHNESVEITILEALPHPPPRSRRRWLRPAAISTLGLAAVGVAAWFGLAPPVASLASIDLGSNESLGLHSQATEQEVPPDALDPMMRFPIPKHHGVPLDQEYPTLADWKHPVVKTTLMLPLLPTGDFGAEREGVHGRRECGRGHCGADIGGPVGRPIVAVAEGVVLNVDRSRNGKDGHSGRYVRIEHDDGTVTAYMHLNAVTAGLDVGDHVRAGQQIGTLGATGVRRANPHLHFALELPNVKGAKGVAKSTHYINPAPFLVRAQVIDAPDRRRPRKPST